MRYMPIPGLLLTAAALSLGCDGGPTQPADAPKRPSLRLVFNDVHHETLGTATNDCTGEVITATAIAHDLLTLTEDAAGGLHVHALSTVHFAGTSEISGAEYSGVGIINQTFNDGGAGHEETLALTFTLIGKGSVPNEVATVLFHIRVLPDGTLTSSIDTFRLHCQ